MGQDEKLVNLDLKGYTNEDENTNIVVVDTQGEIMFGYICSFYAVFNGISLPLYIAFAFSFPMLCVCWFIDLIVLVSCYVYWLKKGKVLFTKYEKIGLIPFDVAIYVCLSLFVCDTPTCIDFYNVSFFVAIGRLSKFALATQLRIKRVLYLPFLFYDFVDRARGRVYFLFSHVFNMGSKGTNSVLLFDRPILRVNGAEHG